MVRVYTDGGFVNGFHVPSHAKLELIWLPADQPDALMTLHGNDLTQHVFAIDVADISLSSNGATFFSHQPGTAAIASLVDRFLAGWSGHLTFRNGDYLTWTVVSGPPPPAQLLSMLQAKMNNARRGHGSVPFANFVLDVAPQHDEKMLAFASQESPESYLALMGGVLDAAERGDFPGGLHALVAAESPGVSRAVALAIVRQARAILNADTNALHPDFDVSILDAAATVVDAHTILWVDAFDKDLRPGSRDADALVDLLVMGDQNGRHAEDLMIIVAVPLGSTAPFQPYAIPIVEVPA